MDSLPKGANRESRAFISFLAGRCGRCDRACGSWRSEEIGVAGSAADIFRRAGVFAAKAKHRGICRRSRTHSRSCGTPCRAPCSGRRAVRPLARALQPIPGSVPRSAGLPHTHDAHAEKLIRNGGSVTCMTRQAAMYSRSRGLSLNRCRHLQRPFYAERRRLERVVKPRFTTLRNSSLICV